MTAIGTLTNAPAIDLLSQRRIRAANPLHAEIREFLEDEAALLDHERLDEWLALLADDVHYRMPVRLSVHRAGGDGFARRMFFYNDTRSVLAMRVKRLLDTNSGWVEDPPSRTTRIVSGVRVFATDIPGDYAVESTVLLTRSRSDLGEVKLLSARRHDTVRAVAGAFALAKRDVYLDQTTIDMHNLAIFL
jgi:phthalate 3,4-dioxygenase beta subunit